MIGLQKLIQLIKNDNLLLFSIISRLTKCNINIRTIPSKNLRNFILYINHFLSFNFLLENDMRNFLDNSLFDKVMLSVEHIKVQELTFLAEYYLVTTLFCLTLFALFSFKLVLDEKHFLIRFQYSSQLIFLLIFGLVCYLILVFQQFNLSLLPSVSFNYTISNDQLSIISKLIIGISSIIYLIFISQYLKDQKLNNFEYYIIILTSIFGFFLLCGANDLITAYLAIELQGLAFYVLASFKKSSNFSIESGVKYFVLGSLSTAIFLLGVTFVYGFSGSVLLTDFKDFFIWVFSANSFFLPIGSVVKDLSVDTDLSSNELQVIFDNFEVLKKKMFGSLSSVDQSSYWYYQDAFDLTSSSSEKEFYILNIENNSLLLNVFFIDHVLLDVYTLFLGEMESNIFNDFQEFEASFYKSFTLGLNENSKEIVSFPILDKIFNNSEHFISLSNSLSLEEVSDILIFCDLCSDELLKTSSMISAYSNDNLSLELNNVSEFGSADSASLQTAKYYSYISFLVDFGNLFLGNSVITEVTSNDYLISDLSFLIIGMLIILLALFFKLALAPFHLWSPDVYEGAPSSSTFFFMIISKFSLFVFLLRFCYSSFYSFIAYWQFYSLLIATVSIFIGAVAGLKQRRLKSLLTYSSINNMGFVLLAFSVGGFEGIQIKFYYLIVYILSGLCIWAIILNLKLRRRNYFEKQNRDIGDLALLQESNNSVAQSLGATLFTLAGLPPMVGFLAKMSVFKALSGVSIFFFSVTNILFSVIATFYYLRIIKVIFFENLLVGNLYSTINTRKTFIINFLTFLLLFLFISPMFLYFYSYKITLLLNKSFY